MAGPLGSLVAQFRSERQAPAGGSLVSQWRAERAPQPQPSLVAQWRSERPGPGAPSPTPPGDYGLTTMEEGVKRGEAWQRPKPAPAPKHFGELARAEQAIPQRQKLAEATAEKQAEPWTTHIDPNAGFAHNVLATPAYLGKVAGEMLMAPLRAARGIPGMQQGFELLDETQRQGKALLGRGLTPEQQHALDYLQARAADPGGPVSAPPPNESQLAPGDRGLVRSQDPNAGYYPADLAARLPAALAGKFAPGGSAVFGESARQQVEALAAPRDTAKTAAEAHLYSDPRNSESLVNQFFREKLGPLGALFDPQTNTPGQQLEEQTQIPGIGLAADAILGGKLTPSNLMRPVRRLAGNVAEQFLTPTPGRIGQGVGRLANSMGGGLVERVLRTELPTLPSLSQVGQEVRGLFSDPAARGFDQGVAEFGQQLGATPASRQERWLAQMAERERANMAANQAARGGIGRLAQAEREVPVAEVPQAPPPEIAPERPAPIGPSPLGHAPTEPVPPAGESLVSAWKAETGRAPDPAAPAYQPVALEGVRESLPGPTAQQRVGSLLERAAGRLRLSPQAISRSVGQFNLTPAEVEQAFAGLGSLETNQKVMGALGLSWEDGALRWRPGVNSSARTVVARNWNEQAELARALEFAPPSDPLKVAPLRSGQLAAQLREANPPAVPFDENAGVQYANQVPGVQGNSTAPPRAPLQTPGPATAPPSTAPSLTGSIPAGPGVDIPVRSEAQITRDLRQTLGMLGRGETKRKGLVDSVFSLFEPPSGTRVSLRGKAAAYHKNRELIEVRQGSGTEGVWHEAGHAIEKASPLIGNASPTMLNELELLGDPGNARATAQGVGPSWRPGMSVQYQRGEGLAEFTRLWMQFPEEAQRLAPEFSKQFERWLDSSGPTGERLRMHQADVQARQATTFERRFEAQNLAENARQKLAVKSERTGVTQWLFDRFHPLRQIRDRAAAGGMRVSPLQDPYRKSTMLRSQATGETNRELQALGKILDPLRKSKNPEALTKEFEHYLEARHFQDMDREGLATGMSRFDVKAMLAKHAGNKQFEDMAQALYDFQRSQMDYAVGKGMLSQAYVDDLWTRFPSYIPAESLLELAAEELPVKGAGRGGSTMQGYNPVKMPRNLDREVLSPLTSLVEHTAKIRLQTLKNDVGRDLMRLWDSQGEGIGHSLSEIEIPEGFGQASLERANALRVVDGDAVRYFQLEPKLFKAFHEEALGENLLTAANQAWNKVLRPGATTYNPGFFLWNIFRDSAAMPFVTRVGGSTNVPFFPFLEGMGTQVMSALGDTKARSLVDEFRASGGHQDFGAAFADRAGADAARLELTHGPPGKLDRVKGGLVGATLGGALGGAPGAAVGAGLGGLAGGRRVAALVDAGEQSNRLGHYLAAKRFFRAKNPSWSQADVDYAAAFEARDVLDFSRRGSSSTVRQLRANVPFVGAGMEGTRRAAAAVIENPLRVLAAGLALGVAPEAWNLWRNGSDPDYWQIPQERRDRYFYVKNPLWDGKNPDWKFIPFPRAQGFLANFSRAPEWAAQAKMGGAPTGRHMLSTLSQEVLPGNFDVTQPLASAANLAGPVPGTAFELLANRNLYNQRNIVPDRIAREHDSARLQADEGTSVTAKGIANVLNGVGWKVSPMLVDHALYRLGAGAGQNLINYVADPLLSQATGIEQSPRRSGGDALGRAADTLRLRYKAWNFESVDRFDNELDRLRALRDEAENAGGGKGRTADPAYAKFLSREDHKRLNAMEATAKTVNALKKQLTGAPPEKRADLQGRIRKLTSDPRFGTAAPGGRP